MEALHGSWRLVGCEGGAGLVEALGGAAEEAADLLDTEVFVRLVQGAHPNELVRTTRGGRAGGTQRWCERVGDTVAIVGSHGEPERRTPFGIDADGAWRVHVEWRGTPLDEALVVDGGALVQTLSVKGGTAACRLVYVRCGAERFAASGWAPSPGPRDGGKPRAKRTVSFNPELEEVRVLRPSFDGFWVSRTSQGLEDFLAAAQDAQALSAVQALRDVRLCIEHGAGDAMVVHTRSPATDHKVEERVGSLLPARDLLGRDEKRVPRWDGNTWTVTRYMSSGAIVTEERTLRETKLVQVMRLGDKTCVRIFQPASVGIFKQPFTFTVEVPRSMSSEAQASSLMSAFQDARTTLEKLSMLPAARTGNAVEGPEAPAAVRIQEIEPDLPPVKSAVEEEVYQNERHLPMFGWGPNFIAGDPKTWSSRDLSSSASTFPTTDMPEGWEWLDEDWSVDLTGAGKRCVDKDGWAYNLEWSSLARTFKPDDGVMQVYHVVRRRRWRRRRVRKALKAKMAAPLTPIQAPAEEAAPQEQRGARVSAATGKLAQLLAWREVRVPLRAVDLFLGSLLLVSVGALAGRRSVFIPPCEPCDVCAIHEPSTLAEPALPPADEVPAVVELVQPEPEDAETVDDWPTTHWSEADPALEEEGVPHEDDGEQPPEEDDVAS